VPEQQPDTVRDATVDLWARFTDDMPPTSKERPMAAEEFNRSACTPGCPNPCPGHALTVQQLDPVTALAESMARYDAERNGYPWRGWEALYEEGRTHYLGQAGAVLDSGLVVPAADASLKQDVLDLADEWKRLSMRRALPARRRELDRCATELRALVAGGEA